MSGRKLAVAALAFTFVAGGVAGAVIAAPTVSAAYDGGSDRADGGEGGGEGCEPLPGRPGHAGAIAAAAKEIGVSTDDLLTELGADKSIADVAEAKDKDPADVVDAIVAQMTERIDEAVKDGRIDEDEANERKEGLTEFATDFVNRKGPPVRDGRRLAVHAPLETAAKTIGVSRDELATQLRDGKSIADVAEANGKDPADVVDAMVADAGKRIDEAVKDGRIDEDDANERKARLKESVTEMVNHKGLPEPGLKDRFRELPRPR